MPTTPERTRSEQKAQVAHAFDLVAEEYEAANGAFHNSIGRRLVELTGPRPGDRVLDLGCGRGAVLFAAARAVGPNGYVVGVDLSPGMVHATAAEAARRGLRNVLVRVDDAEDPGFPHGSFELVLSSLTMHLLPEPAAAFRAAHHVLTPGGRFGMTTFGCDETPGWDTPFAALLPFTAKPDSEPRKAACSGLPDEVEDIAALLRDAGFTETTTTEETVTTEYPDPEAWWRSVWSGGRRPLLETIPPERRDTARDAAFAALQHLADPTTGRLVRRTVIRYTLARR
jgi:ubiquinone/menaquinone biosynthesis C-methylase UbiE